MDAQPHDAVPCSSNTVSAIINVGVAGAIWGLCTAPHDASKYGLTGRDRAVFLANSVARITLQCALVGGISTSALCASKRYRGKDDWLNGLISGVTAGAAVCAVSRNWRQMIPTACLISALTIASNCGRKNVNTC